MLPDDKWLCCPVASGAHRRLPSVPLLLSAVHHNYLEVLSGDPKMGKNRAVFEKLCIFCWEDNLGSLKITNH